MCGKKSRQNCERVPYTECAMCVHLASRSQLSPCCAETATIRAGKVTSFYSQVLILFTFHLLLLLLVFLLVTCPSLNITLSLSLSHTLIVEPKTQYYKWDLSLLLYYGLVTFRLRGRTKSKNSSLIIPHPFQVD